MPGCLLWWGSQTYWRQWEKYAQGTDFIVQSYYSLTTESFISSVIFCYRMKYTQSVSLLFCKKSSLLLWPFPPKKSQGVLLSQSKNSGNKNYEKEKKTFQKFLLNKENDESWYHSDYVTFRIFSTVKSHMFSSISLNSASIWVDRASLLHLPEVLVLKAYLEGIMSYSSCLSYTLNSCCLKKNIKLITERQRIIIKNPPFLLWSSVIRISTSTFGSVFSNSETKLHQCPYIRMSSWRGLTPASS